MRWIVVGLLTLAIGTPARAASPAAVEGTGGMVVSSQRLASEAGAAILRQGGNAVDAAVATAYALAVTNPCCGNIGGGGFLVARLADGSEHFIDFREKAPAAATRDMFLDAGGAPVPDASLIGWKSAGVPGTVLGLETARARWGRLPRAQVLAPAIALARDGFVLTRGDSDILAAKTALFQRYPDTARIFLRPDNTPFQPGDRLVQADLARTLERVAADGPDGFYRGPVAQAVESAARAGGGIITAADLAAYTAPVSEPLRCRYRGVQVLSAPPPSSGGITICQVLGILEGYDLHSMGWNSAAAVHLMTEAMRHAFLDRNTRLGDPDFVDNPVAHLLDPAYHQALRAVIDPAHATPSSQLPPGTPPHEKPETTHLSVVDRDGSAVALTYTINGLFGAGVVAPGWGFLLNDEMDDFTVKAGVPNLFGLVQGEANAIAPGKRPLSSMAPTIALRDGQPFLVLGSPGGSRIISIVLETLLNVVDHGMTLQEAVDAPRLHHQWLPDTLFAEPRALSADTRKVLEGMGHTIREQTPWGATEAIAIGPSNPAGPSSVPVSSGNDSQRSGGMVPGLRYGAHDSRRPAGAAIAE